MNRPWRIMCGVILAVLSVVGFASTFLVGTELSVDMALSPSVLSFLRFVIASAVLLVVALPSKPMRRRLFSSIRGNWVRMALLGTIGASFMAWCVFNGCARVPVANSSMADALSPLGIFAVSLVVTRRATALQLAGLAIGFAGALLTIGVIDAHGLALSAYGTGDLFILVSATVWGIYTVLGRADVERMGAYSFSFWTMALGAAVIGVLLAATQLACALCGGGSAMRLAVVWPHGAHAWALVAFLGFFCTLMPFFAWNAAQKFMPLSVLGMSAYFTPVAAILLDKAIYGRSVTGLQWLGALLICVSAVVELGRNRGETRQ